MSAPPIWQLRVGLPVPDYDALCALAFKHHGGNVSALVRDVLRLLIEHPELFKTVLPR